MNPDRHVQPSSSGTGLGQRVLQQMALGIRDDQNDIDVRDPKTRANSIEEDRLRRTYQPRQNGEVVDRRTGNPVPEQKYLGDTLYTDTEISFDKIWEGNDDYKLATETAGHANISVEAFITQNNGEHIRAVSAHQRDLLIEERKKRMVSFAARNNELREIQKTRKEIETVMQRLHNMYIGILPTIRRWYWLGSFTGTLPPATPLADPTIVQLGAQVPVPFWLMTEYVRWQYMHLTEKNLFTSDGQIWTEAHPNASWTLQYLTQISETFDGILSLTDEQRRFASAVYLILRDGVFTKLLKVVDPAGSAGSPPHLYKDLFTVVDQVRSQIQKTISKETIRSEAVTRSELDATMADEDIELFQKKEAIKKVASTEDVLDQVLRTSVIQIFADGNDTGAAFDFNDFLTSNVGKSIGQRFFDQGFLLGFANLAKLLDGVSPAGLGAWISLLHTSIAHVSIPYADSSFQKAFVEKDATVFTMGDGQRVDIAFDPAIPRNRRFELIEYAVLWNLPPKGGKTDLTHKRDPVMDTEKFDLKIGATVVLSITFSHLGPEVIKGIKELADSGTTLIEAIFKKSPDMIPAGRWQQDVTRQILTLVFWSIVMRSRTFLGSFLDSLTAFGRNVEDHKIINTRTKFLANNEFIKLALAEPIPLLSELRKEVAIPLHFYRELFRTLYLDDFERSNITESVLVTETKPDSLLFKKDVKSETDTIAPDKTKNDTLFLSVWDKLYANFFLPNPEEYARGARPGEVSIPYWRNSLARAVEGKKPLDDGKKRPDDGTFSSLWRYIVADHRFTTQRMRLTGGVSAQDLALNITKVGETESQVANIQKYAFNVKVEGLLNQWKNRLVSERMQILLPDQSVTGAVPPMTIFHTLIIFTQAYYPEAISELRTQLENADATLAKMIDILQASLTNDPSLALKELKQLAHETYLPDSRYHNQSKYTGRLVFTALFIAATHVAYVNLQHLAHLPPPPEFNMYGKRPRIVPVNYSYLRDVPLDVLSANTNPANDASGAPMRDYIDMTTPSSSTSALMMLRSGMGNMIAQHIFGVRLNAPDEYKSVIQHKRAPGELAAAQKAMAKFRFSKTGKPRGWSVTIEY